MKKRRIRLWRVLNMAVQAIGVGLLLLAPGNFARAAEEASRGFVMEMIYRAAVVCYCLLRHVGIPMLLALIALIVAVRKKVPLRAQWLSVLVLSAALSAGALIGSPQISDRSFTAVIVLVIAALLCVMADKKPAADAHSLRVGMALMLVCAVLGVRACAQTRTHAEAWNAQVDAIGLAVRAGEERISVCSVPSELRYTMSIVLAEDPAQWPNSTLGRYYGICIAGE